MVRLSRIFWCLFYFEPQTCIRRARLQDRRPPIPPPPTSNYNHQLMALRFREGMFVQTISNDRFVKVTHFVRNGPFGGENTLRVLCYQDRAFLLNMEELRKQFFHATVAAEAK